MASQLGVQRCGDGAIDPTQSSCAKTELGGHRVDDGSARGRRMTAVPGKVLIERGLHGGGDGARTTLISGCFRFSAGAPHPLLRSLPPIVHFRSDEVLDAMVKLIALERPRRALAARSFVRG